MDPFPISNAYSIKIQSCLWSLMPYPGPACLGQSQAVVAAGASAGPWHSSQHFCQLWQQSTLGKQSTASNWATWGQTCDTMWLDAVRFESLTVIRWHIISCICLSAECGQTQWVTLILTEHSLTVTSSAWAWAWAAWLSQATSVSQASPLQPICNTQNTQNTVWLSVSPSL